MNYFDYATFKGLVSAANLPVVYYDDSQAYHCFASSPSFMIGCFLPKDSGADQTDFETYLKPKANQSSPSNSPYATKQLGTKKLYAAYTGQQFAVSIGSNTLDFSIPYAWVKFTGLELINGEALDYADLSVYDNSSGTYSGVPNLKLNQFGFSVNIGPVFHSRVSKFDADAYIGMIVRVTYNSISAKTVGVNYIMDKVV